MEKYKLGLYKSLKVKNSSSQFDSQFHLAPEAPGLVGFLCGNSEHQGCLTEDEAVRIHSCERPDYCSTVKKAARVVWIRPIVARLDGGHDLTEVGVGGGGNDLEQQSELDCRFLGPEDIQKLFQMYATLLLPYHMGAHGLTPGQHTRP